MVKLTQKYAAAQKLPDGNTEKFFWCGELPGFALRLRKQEGGLLHRTWVAQYRIKGRQRRLTLGQYAKLTEKQARDLAKVAFAKVALGEDPQATKEAERASAARALRTIVADYLALKESTLRPASYRVTRFYLTGDRYFKPLHSRGIAEIGRADVAPCLNRITRNSGRVTASRARAALSAFFTWAIKQGYVDSNPVIATEDPGPAQARERVLSDSEIAAIWKACRDDNFGKIVRLLILLGCRREEIGGLRWSEIALNRATLTLPPERVKNNHAHTLPLLPLARAIIASVPERVSRDHLFGDCSGVGFTGWQKAKQALDDRLLGEVVDEWTLHDLRRTMATRMVELGVEPHVVEAVLNHFSGHRAGIAGVYNRAKYEKQIRIALSIWGDHLQSIISGGERKVVPLHGPAA
jgi:integrase